MDAAFTDSAVHQDTMQSQDWEHPTTLSLRATCRNKNEKTYNFLEAKKCHRMLNSLMYPSELLAMARWKLTKDPDAIPAEAVGKNLR